MGTFIMTIKYCAKTLSAVGVAFGLLALASPISAQTYTPANWVNDPLGANANANYAVTGGTTTSPSYANNGTATGSLFGNSPIGATLTLVNPGDTIAFTGQVTLAGNVNASGNVQFRVGLYDQGSASTDTGWLGYMIGNPTGAGGGGVYLRNNPNTGVYASGTGTTQPTIPAGSFTFATGWGADTYNFSLSVQLLSSTSDLLTWSLAGVTDGYSYSGTYTDTTVSTEGGLSFDQVGFLGGGSTFNSASTSDVITFSNPTVTLTPAPEPSTLALAGLGLAALLRRQRRNQ